MQIQGMQPNNVTYMLALKACAGSASLNNAYVEDGLVFEAFFLFTLMKERGYKPDEITFSIILKVCAHVTTVEHGRCVHLQLMKSGLKLDAYASSVFIDIYMKCGSHIDAWRMFDQLDERSNTVWNAMIAGCNDNGLPERSFALFEQFIAEGNVPDKMTIIGVLKACIDLPVQDHARAIHVYVMEAGLLSDLSTGNTILEAYVNCGRLEDASHVLAHMPTRDVVSWNTVIVTSIQKGLGEHALFLFGQMLQENVKPNHITFSSVLKVCANLPALEWGMEIHMLVNTSACESFISVGSTLVDMYAKCGTIDDAFQVFDSMEERQLVAWTAMIAGCALQGLCKEAIELFERMQDEGIIPDTVTFVAVLSACSRAGLLDEGWFYFILINTMCFDALTPDHIACMVDLLARAGQLQEAKNLITDMPIASDDVVWMVLLDACRIHRNIDMGRYAFECILKCDPSCYQAYVVLSNIYTLSGMWDEVLKISEDMKL